MLTLIRNKRKKGFTLIELLVVVLILAILMAVALPLYLNSIQNSERRTCRANLQSIGNAYQAQRVATRGPVPAAGAVAIANAPDLLAVPVCPTGGAYSIAAGTTGSFAVVCANHGTFEYGADAQ